MTSRYSPGCKVARWRPADRAMSARRSIIHVVIHDREYYIGKGDEKGLRCEDWGKASREWAAGMPSLEIVGAFVPYP